MGVADAEEGGGAALADEIGVEGNVGLEVGVEALVDAVLGVGDSDGVESLDGAWLDGVGLEGGVDGNAEEARAWDGA